ncbi:MAG TPA: MATE family efflux transporter [Candidatus Acidoferrales bacterium]|nr:MATE family efflux transporter [Candidatus Acidoferrales bacterium]
MSEFLESVPEVPGSVAMTLPPIGRMRAEVWALAWPVILSFGLDSILGLSSMLMVGRLGANAVGAVGLATQILGAVRAGIAAVGTGTVALVARYIGANDRDSAEEVLKQSVIFGVIVSTVVAVPVIVFARPLMSVFQVKGEMAEMGARYLQVVMLSEPFQGIFLMCASALRGAGDTRTPLWIGGIIDVIAIFLNYVLIFGKFGFPQLGVDGSAVATLLAIAIGGVLFFYALSIDGMVLNFRWHRLRPDLGLGRRILSVGNPAAIEQLLIQFGFVAYVGFVARYGPKEIAAYFIGVRILALSFLPGFGFSAASATLVGQGLGARDPKFSRRAGWESTGMSIVLMSAMGLLFIVFAHQIAALFIDDKQVIEYTVQFMYALAAAQPLMAIDWTITGALRGAGDSQFPLYGSLAGFYGMRLALTILITLNHGNINYIWWSLLADYLVRSTIKTWRFRQGHWETIEV